MTLQRTTLADGDLTLDELLELSSSYGIYATVPYSYLEAEAILLSVDVEVVLRQHLRARLQEVGLLCRRINRTECHPVARPPRPGSPEPLARPATARPSLRRRHARRSPE